MRRQLISSSSPFEQQIGYARGAVQSGSILMSGTTGFDCAFTRISAVVEEQVRQCLEKIRHAFAQADTSLADVVRMRHILPSGDDFEKCWSVLRKHFGEVRAAETMSSASLVDLRILMEIEVTALQPTAHHLAWTQDPLGALVARGEPGPRGGTRALGKSATGQPNVPPAPERPRLVRHGAADSDRRSRPCPRCPATPDQRAALAGHTGPRLDDDDGGAPGAKLKNKKPSRFPDWALGSDEIFRSLLIAATALTPDSHKRWEVYQGDLI
jgi:enamine deaminase RidA (YjgF/YER057c/UK114 family)